MPPTTETHYLLTSATTAEPHDTAAEAAAAAREAGPGLYEVTRVDTTRGDPVPYLVPDQAALTCVEIGAGKVELRCPAEWQLANFGRDGAGSGAGWSGPVPATGVPTLWNLRAGATYMLFVELANGITVAKHFTTAAAATHAGGLSALATTFPALKLARSSAPRDPAKGDLAFRADSAYNAPMCDAAVLVPAGITVDGYDTRATNPVNMPCPTEDPIKVFLGDGTTREVLRAVDWGAKRGKILQPRTVLSKLALPNGTTYSSSRKHNDGFAIYDPATGTYYQGQPICVENNGPILVGAPKDRVDAWGDGNTFPDGRSGAKGPSGGSGAPGAAALLQVGDFDDEYIPHRLSFMLDMARASRSTPRFVAPALSADNYANGGFNPAGASGYGTDPLRNGIYVMGSMLALRPDFDWKGLRTEPGRKLALTCIRFGGPVVDDGLAQIGIRTQEGATSFLDYFRNKYGYSFNQRLKASTSAGQRWAHDVRDIFLALCVVRDAKPGQWGGAGLPLATARPLVART